MWNVKSVAQGVRYVSASQKAPGLKCFREIASDCVGTIEPGKFKNSLSGDEQVIGDLIIRELCGSFRELS